MFISRAAVGDMGAGKIFRASQEDTWSKPAEVQYPVNYGEDRADLAPRPSFGRMRILCAIHPPDAIRKILDCLGLPSRPPPIAGAFRGEPDFA